MVLLLDGDFNSPMKIKMPSSRFAHISPSVQISSEIYIFAQRSSSSPDLSVSLIDSQPSNRSPSCSFSPISSMKPFVRNTSWHSISAQSPICISCDLQASKYEDVTSNLRVRSFSAACSNDVGHITPIQKSSSLNTLIEKTQSVYEAVGRNQKRNISSIYGKSTGIIKKASEPSELITRPFSAFSILRSSFSAFDPRENCGVFKNSSVLQESVQEVESIPIVGNNDNLLSINDFDPSLHSSLQAQVKSLSCQLIRAQSGMENVLEEKNPVVGNGLSEELLLEAQSRIMELESILDQSITKGATMELEMIARFEEMNQALTTCRENAENLRHSLRKEERRSTELTNRLQDAEEALFGEQEKNSSLLDAIQILNLEIDSLKALLEESNNKVERLSTGIVSEETEKKLMQVTEENTALQLSFEKLQNIENVNIDLLNRIKVLEASYLDYALIKEDLKHCQIREAQLSEFTKRLTERNAGLQADYLSAQSRLEATERAVAEARSAAEVSGKLVQSTADKFNLEKEDLKLTLLTLQKKLNESENDKRILESSLNSEKSECLALRKMKVTLDRELARLHSHTMRISANGNESKSESTESIAKENIGRFSEPADADSLNNFPPNSISPDESSFISKIRNENDIIATFNPNWYHWDKADLISKIESSHKLNRKLLDKVDFLRDHTNHLTEELQKKTALLYHYFFVGTEAGSANSLKLDANKMFIIQKGGLMASIFAGRDVDEQANLKVCLEINQKMQLILEDALLKNIHLKEHVDSLLGDVDGLTRVNAELKELLKQNNVSL